MIPETPASTEADARPEANPRLRRRIFWCGWGLICVFAAGFLQFALADRLAWPAEKRINDGEHATFFAVHVNPYYVFSEDFHLYVVRAKRILDRGWTDSPLASSADQRASYTAPLQAGLMMLAVATDGRPVPYSLLIVGVLTVAWSILYFAAARWLPKSVSPLTVPAAVLMTVLFESFDGLLHPDGEFGQWPVHRGLRMATLAWTSPLLLSVVIASVSLLFRRERPTARLTFVALALTALALSDTWSFLLAASCVAVTIVAIGTTAAIRWHPDTQSAHRAWLIGGGLAFAGLLALGAHQATTHPMTGDVLTRAGFGPEWKESGAGVGQTRTFERTVRAYAGGLLAFAAAVSLAGAVRFSRAPLRLQIEAGLVKPAPDKLQLVALAAAPIAGFVILIEALSRLGMDEYHLFQFVWRLQFVLLFCGMVVLSETAKLLVRRVHLDPIRSAHWEVALAALFLGALLFYHSTRIYQFVSGTVASEFFLTKDAEALRDWLRWREESLGNYTLATASHELNYLCAYWSRADLLLPEGFPYHSSAANDEIEQRTAELLAVYGATPECWIEFNLHRHVWDQWSWGQSRLLSARHGYMYYLMHRGLLLEGNVAKPPSTEHPSHTTPHFAELRLKHDEALRRGSFLDLRAGVEAAKRIAEKLQMMSDSSAAAKPDVILVDEVSRALGKPNLKGYRREFQHGDLEAWVLQYDGWRTAEKPPEPSARPR